MNWQVTITICNSYRFRTNNGDNYPYMLQQIINSLWHHWNNFCKEVLCPQGEKSQLWEIFWASGLWNNYNVSSTCWVQPITGAMFQYWSPSLPSFSKYPGYVCFVISYLSLFLRFRIFDELVGKIVIRKASWIIHSNKFDLLVLKILITFPLTQLLYLDLFELCYTYFLTQYVWVPRETKLNE